MVAANINATRDMIILGQRGSLHAKPLLICPEVDRTNERMVGLMRNGPAARRLFVGTNEACRERLLTEDGAGLGGERARRLHAEPSGSYRL
jgi:hypothetical protein